MTIVTFEVAGAPKGKARPRFNPVSGRRPFTPKATATREGIIYAAAAPHFPRPIEGPVRCDIRVEFRVPKSASKKKRAELLGSWCCKKPDRDNIDKLFGDALNGLAWVDDSQICAGEVTKVWSDRDMITVRVEALSPEGA